MTEKIITVYDRVALEIKGIIICKINDKGTLTKYHSLTLFADRETTKTISAHTATFVKPYMNITDFYEKLSESLVNGAHEHNLMLLAPFELLSDNKNKSSRNKRMLENMGLDDLERTNMNEITT